MNRTSNCNRCAIKGCDSFSKKHLNCLTFLDAAPMQVPLLIHLMSDDRKAQNAVDVLAAFDIRIQEIDTYPYFKLVL